MYSFSNYTYVRFTICQIFNNDLEKYDLGKSLHAKLVTNQHKLE